MDKESVLAILKSYDELKRNKDIIQTIDPQFFFSLVDYLIQNNNMLNQSIQDIDGYLDTIQQNIPQQYYKDLKLIIQEINNI